MAIIIFSRAHFEPQECQKGASADSRFTLLVFIAIAVVTL